MTPDDAFLQAILEQPEDDGPRLMYADWLEERGDPRGEFIRAQCELARSPDDDPRRPHWQTVERELLGVHRVAWLGPLHSLAYCWEFRRGFAEGVAVEASAFLQHASLFFSRTPLRLARLVRPASHVRALAASSALGRLAALHLTNTSPSYGIGDEGVQQLAASRHLASLTTLRLNGNDISDDGALALAESPNVKSLTTLTLTRNHISDVGAAFLASSPNLVRLTTLDLDGNLLSPRGIAKLRALRRLNRQGARDLDDSGPAEGGRRREPSPGAAVLC
jgi:uncharacterized protein (TIGR02996 family)